MRKRYNFKNAIRNPYSGRMRVTERDRQLAALAKMKDEDIDYSDIPPIRDWSKAVRGKFYRSPLAVFCADIGSIKKSNFGWYGVYPDREGSGGEDIQDLVGSVVKYLSINGSVSLGFECPLFVPISDVPHELTSARLGEGNRAWCAGAGAGSLATGLTEVLWILREVRRSVGNGHRAFLDWKRFQAAGKGLLLWEAFVSGKSKAISNIKDAEFGARSFCGVFRDPHRATEIRCPDNTQPYSLIGAALLRSGWSRDLKLLASQNLVVKAGAAVTNISKRQRSLREAS